MKKDENRSKKRRMEKKDAENTGNDW